VGDDVGDRVGRRLGIAGADVEDSRFRRCTVGRGLFSPVTLCPVSTTTAPIEIARSVCPVYILCPARFLGRSWPQE
jgi:hypothetical protein